MSPFLRLYLPLLAFIAFVNGEIRYIRSRPNDPADGEGSIHFPFNSLAAAFDPKNGVADGDELRFACGDYPAWWGESPIYAVNVTLLGGFWDQGSLNCTPVIRSSFMFRRLDGRFTNVIMKNLQFESGKAIRFVGPDDGPAYLDNVQISNCQFYQRGISAGVVKLRDISVGPGGLIFEDVVFETLYPLIDTAWFSISYLSRDSSVGPTILRRVRSAAYGFAQPLSLEFRNATDIVVEDSNFFDGSYLAFYRCRRIRVSNNSFDKQGVFMSRVSNSIVENNRFASVGSFPAHILLRPVSVLIGSTPDWTLERIEIVNNTFVSYAERPLHDPIAAIEFSSLGGHGYKVTAQRIKYNKFYLQGIKGVFAVSNANLEVDVNSTYVDASENWFASVNGPLDEWCNPDSNGAAINPDPINNATIGGNDAGTSGVFYRPWCIDAECTQTTMGGELNCVNPASKEGKWRIGLGIGLGASLFVIVLIFAALLFFRLRLKRSQEAAMRLLDDYTTLKTRLWDDITSVQDLLARNNILYINYDDIKFGKQLGVGSYGKVTSGVVTVPKAAATNTSKNKRVSATSLLGNMSPDMVTIPVAIKELHQSALETYETISEFLREVNVMSRFDHPNLLRLLGISLHEIHEKQSVLLITELMTNGSLDTVLFSPDPSRPDLPYPKKLRIAEDVAHGMLFLHAKQPAVVHRDLKPGNVLLDAQMNAKIADFGLAKTMDKATATMTLRGTPVYLAPECISAGKFSEASDVFAYGVTIYEMFAGVRAYSNETGGIVNLMHRVAHEGLRPDVSAAKLPQDIDSLIKDCLQTEPMMRPSFAEVVTRLRNISSQ